MYVAPFDCWRSLRHRYRFLHYLRVEDPSMAEIFGLFSFFPILLIRPSNLLPLVKIVTIVSFPASLEAILRQNGDATPTIRPPSCPFLGRGSRRCRRRPPRTDPTAISKATDFDAAETSAGGVFRRQPFPPPSLVRPPGLRRLSSSTSLASPVHFTIHFHMSSI